MRPYTSIEGFVHDLSALAEKHSERLSSADGLYCMELTDGRTWYVDIHNGKVAVTDASDEVPCCTVKASERIVLDLLAGEINPVKAILLKKVHVSGDIRKLLKLASLA